MVMPLQAHFAIFFLLIKKINFTQQIWVSQTTMLYIKESVPFLYIGGRSQFYLSVIGL